MKKMRTRTASLTNIIWPPLKNSQREIGVIICPVSERIFFGGVFLFFLFFLKKLFKKKKKICHACQGSGSGFRVRSRIKNTCNRPTDQQTIRFWYVGLEN